MGPNDRTRRGRVVRRVMAIASGALLLPVAACGGSGTGSADDTGGTRHVTVAIPPAVSGVDVYAAQSRGYFAEHHLSVDVKTLNGGAAIVPALESGAVQIGESNVLSVIQGAARNVKEPCFSGANTDPKGGHYLSLVAGPKSGVTGPPGLRGKTVAVNATSGINALLVSAYLAGHGVGAGSVKFIGMKYPDMPGSLSGGRVPVAMTTEPFTSIALGRGAKLLTGTPLASIPGRPTYSCWNSSKSWLADNRATASAFAAAMKETDGYINAHPDAFRALVGKHLKIAPKIQASMTLPVFTDHLDMGDVTAWENAGKKYHILNGATPANGDVLMAAGR